MSHMRPNEAPCSPVEPCGAQWNPMEPSGTPWSPYGARWSPVEPLWGPMEPCGAFWSSAVLWSPVKLYDDPNAHPKNASMSVSESASDFVFRIAEMMARKCDPIFRSLRFSMVEKIGSQNRTQNRTRARDPFGYKHWTQNRTQNRIHNRTQNRIHNRTQNRTHNRTQNRAHNRTQNRMQICHGIGC